MLDDFNDKDWSEDVIMTKEELLSLILQLNDKDFNWIKNKINSIK